MNTTKKEERKINQIQENIIRRILMVPQSTPIDTLYTETGLLDITTIITKNRFNMEKKTALTPRKYNNQNNGNKHNRRMERNHNQNEGTN